jgi:oligopeptide transport system permease protein
VTPHAAGWRRLRRNRMAVLCGVVLLATALFCLLGPLIAARFGLDGVTQNARLGATPPSAAHWLGTDVLGRDLLVRCMEGGRYALLVAFLGTAVALLIGVSWGAISAYAGGRLDDVMMRIVDVLYALPTIMFVIVVQAVVDVQSLFLLFLLIGGISWLTMARIVRGQVMSLKHREFVEAARALGASPGRLLFGHIVPNTTGPIIVYATLSIPNVMLTEAVLSFLGLGVQAPRASWGTLVAEGVGQLVVYPWVLAGPGAFLAVTIFAFNFLGDGLRDALDPQTRAT